MGDNTYGQCNVPADLRDVLAISAGSNHNPALKKDGTVVAWGENKSGESNVPGNLRGVKAIGWQRLLPRPYNDGTIVCWGSNRDGQCDVPKE